MVKSILRVFILLLCCDDGQRQFGIDPWTVAKMVKFSVPPGGKSFIGGGRKSVRSSLFVGAMVAARCNPQLKSFRDKLVAELPRATYPSVWWATPHRALRHQSLAEP